MQTQFKSKARPEILTLLEGKKKRENYFKGVISERDSTLAPQEIMERIDSLH